MDINSILYKIDMVKEGAGKFSIVPDLRNIAGRTFAKAEAIREKKRLNLAMGKGGKVEEALKATGLKPEDIEVEELANYILSTNRAGPQSTVFGKLPSRTETSVAESISPSAARLMREKNYSMDEALAMNTKDIKDEMREVLMDGGGGFLRNEAVSKGGLAPVHLYPRHLVGKSVMPGAVHIPESVKMNDLTFMHNRLLDTAVGSEFIRNNKKLLEDTTAVGSPFAGMRRSLMPEDIVADSAESFMLKNLRGISKHQGVLDEDTGRWILRPMNDAEHGILKSFSKNPEAADIDNILKGSPKFLEKILTTANDSMVADTSALHRLLQNLDDSYMLRGSSGASIIKGVSDNFEHYRNPIIATTDNFTELSPEILGSILRRLHKANAISAGETSESILSKIMKTIPI